ncbi:MAG: hypothetical protein FD143_1204 [Ignavibacteria bacterium]|nr:MAG: hypothetical protein FD143_1204 [Ignavibacteria bacterium]KAF0160714.1 MAG: hypothetical protein FD188_1490 [Ignavibacteria bacterium]
MIEIKLTIDNALQLLIERMKFELRIRQKSGIIKKGLRLEDLSYNETLKLVESSVNDYVFLLPMEIILSKTNLVSIITTTVRTLGRALRKEEFLLFSQRQTRNLVDPIRKFLINETRANSFLKN